MEILDAYDLTGSLRDAGELAGCSHHTVKHYVERRAAAGVLDKAAARPQLIDAYLDKVEEWVERSQGKVRRDVAHEKLVALGYTGFGAHHPPGRSRRSRPTTAPGRVRVRPAMGHRAGHVAAVRLRRRPGRRCEDGAVRGLAGLVEVLVVLPLRDKTMPSVFAALDQTFRRLGGVPTYMLTDNEKTVTVEHIAGIAVRNPQLVAFAEHYLVTVHTCVPADPASKGGTESSVKISKADIVPKDTNLREAYTSFAELEAACEAFCAKVNTRAHRVTRRAPVEMLAEEWARCTWGGGGTAHGRGVRHHSHGAGQYADGDVRVRAVPVLHTLLGATVWVRAQGVGDGEQVVIVHAGKAGLEVARHPDGPPPAARSRSMSTSRLSRPAPGSTTPREHRRIRAPRPGRGRARLWLVEAAAAGTTKMSGQDGRSAQPGQAVRPRRGRLGTGSCRRARPVRAEATTWSSILDHHA